MKVVVRFFGSIVETTGTKEDKIDIGKDACLEDLIEILAQKYGSSFEKLIRDQDSLISKGLVFIVDGKSAHLLNGVKTKLSEGSQVAIVPPYMGG